MTISMKTAACAFFAMAFTTTAAFASDDLQLKIDRSDLKSSAGLERQMSKIKHQVEDFCGVTTGRQPLSQSVKSANCVEDMMEKAIDEIDDPNLTAAYNNNASYAGRFSKEG